MNFQIREETPAALPEYAHIPISFEVLSIFDVQLADQGLSGIVLSERKLDSPYMKDYDAIVGNYDAIANNGPADWAKRWDLSRWGVLTASTGGERIGGCVIVLGTEGVLKHEGRKDDAVLWDLRVHPDYRGQGVGSRLFDAAVAWARERGCRCLKIETQNTNVPACRFYAKQGCVLVTINRVAYDMFPDEVELVWCKEIGSRE